MTPLLHSPDGLEALRRLVSEPSLLAFDFDGTLSPIVADRDAAALAPTTASLLREVCRSYRCALITGRSRGDALARTEGIPFEFVIGNHGMEDVPDPRVLDGGLPFLPIVDETHAALEVTLGDCDGVTIENKGLSLAIHYRRALERSRVRERLLARLAPLADRFRVVPGKMVLNLVPVGAAHKGDALAALIRRTGVARALYVGDDVTDEDVFATPMPAAVTTVRVGTSPASAARFFLPDQRKMDDLLAMLFHQKHANEP